MKKLVLSLAILGFVAFGALSVQNLIASSSQIEIVNFDKDPKKDGEKKAADAKEANAETKTTDAKAACSSSCSDKSASSGSCCGMEKESCSKSSPDKK